MLLSAVSLFSGAFVTLKVTHQKKTTERQSHLLEMGKEYTPTLNRFTCV